jgi:hypothetical protein
VVTLGCGDITMVWDEIQTILAGATPPFPGDPQPAVDHPRTEV